MKKADRIILLVILLAAGLVALSFFIRGQEKEGDKVLSIQLAGEEIERIPLVEENIGRTYEVDNPLGENTLKISEEGVYMAHSSCPDQICRHMAPISQVGETIICLPHKLVVEIKSDTSQEGLDHMVR
ncbi:MAG: NusG domain II-containing protein [Tissierellia bacterium]|nr:NusG domain II-containing protein [Tissierellia bacterium]